MADVPAARQWPAPARSVAYLVLMFPVRLVVVVLLITAICVGVGTAIVWVGLPILAVTAKSLAALSRFERKHAAFALPEPIEEPQRRPLEGGVWQRFVVRLSDSVTWRALAYHLLSFPLSCFEFALGVASIVLLPMAVWVAPGVVSLHAMLASSMLGPTSTTRLRAKTRHLQASRARGVDAAEAERRRIERDLHDGAQQRLVAVAMGLGRAKSKMDNDPEVARSLVAEAHADAKLAIAELRDLARGIYPAVLGDRGLDAALSALAAKCPVPVTVSVDVDPRPPTAVESTSYFLVGEALTNIAKHSQAHHAEVKVRREADTVVVEVTDDGRGGAEMTAGGGLGGLADRAATIDGVVTVFSPLGGPTVVRADLPCAW
jgi:signal transduction histidine kinase